MPVTSQDIPQEQLMLQQKVAAAQAERLIKLGTETAQVLESTLGNATRSYKAITYMSIAMFVVGLALFATSSVYGAFFAGDKLGTLAFSGLGAATFVAVFITGAIDKTQTALSNLVQVEIAFMNFFEQITIWDNYAVLPVGNPLNPIPPSSSKPAKPSKPAQPKPWPWFSSTQRQQAKQNRKPSRLEFDG